MNVPKKTILVKYKSVGNSYLEESRKPYIEIKADRFNPMYHKKLIFQNWWRDSVRTIKIDWHNPWLVTTVGGLVVVAVSFLIFG